MIIFLVSLFFFGLPHSGRCYRWHMFHLDFSLPPLRCPFRLAVLMIVFARAIFVPRVFCFFSKFDTRSASALRIKALHVHRVDLTMCFCSPTDFSRCLVGTGFENTERNTLKNQLNVNEVFMCD